MITKQSIRDALRKHQDTVQSLKAALLTNDGDKVATCLEEAGCAWEAVEKLIVKKFPDEFEPEDGIDTPEEDEEDLDEEEEEEEDSLD